MRRRFASPYLHLVHGCWHYARRHRRYMILFYLLTIGANLLAMGQPYVLGVLINRLQAGGGNLLQEAAFWLGIYVALMLGFWLLHGPSRVIERHVAFRAKQNFLDDHYDMVTRLPMHWHQDHHSGNTVNRINKSSQGLYEFSDMQFVFIEGMVRVLAAFVMLAYISGPIALVQLVFFTLIVALLLRFDRVLVPAIHERNEREHDYSSALFDYIGNIASVISFNLSVHTKSVLSRLLAAIALPLRKEIYINEYKWFTMMMLLVIAEFTIITVYIYAQQSGGSELMLGNVVAIYQYMGSLNWVFFGFASHYERLLRQHTDLGAVEPLVEAFDKQALHDEDKVDLQVRQGEVRFERVDFTYPSGREVFKGLDLIIKPHEKIGLVGRSGAGKTTLVNLLLRFYELPQGQITIDGQSIDAVTYASLRQNIAVIPQDTALFEATLLENIRCGRLDATDEEVEQAARKAHAHEFISQLPAGYGALVGERGVKLSGGQRQRIAIARAILKNAPILILDEATSALDSESEKFIQESFAELMRGKTVIAIAHRLSTISHLDRLVMLDRGHIVEDGSHDELLAKEGYYARLWAMQSGGFLPD